ncbi:MAG: AraC family transcriptional regulator [Candidatus Caldarchaeum sp.]
MRSFPAFSLSDADGVSYSSINAMIRLGQREELEAYLREFMSGLLQTGERDLALAKSRLLALVTVIILSVLELGAPAETERKIIEVAKHVEGIISTDDLVFFAKQFLGTITCCAKPKVNRYAQRLVQCAVQMVRDRYAEDLSDEEVAWQLGLSRSHFRFLFKEITGLPFKRYLTEYRLVKARALLEGSTLPVKVVARRVGYSGVNTFQRAYRAYFGVSPLAHRKPSL